ncbi:class I SAM-dependent methyltransferase [bacterium SCSIO 12643]|nr:class I SAM-dependent methyltransferase [bacterium SCSIO 12643]
MKNENNYHDYVIKDGQFIGDFENMYRDCPDPWTQSTQPNKYARTAGLIHIKNFGIQSVLECGCGLGYYAEWMYRDTGILPKSLDLSTVAIEKAQGLFPHLDFEVADIVKDLVKYQDYDCVLLSEIIWYILPDLQQILEVLKTHFKGKYLLVNQIFYKGQQKYGVEYFTSLSEFIEYIPFEELGHCEATLQSDSTIESSVIFRIN